MDIQTKENIEKILKNSHDCLCSMQDEKARAQYAKAVAEIYATTVENERAAEEIKVEKKKINSEAGARITESVLRFIGTAISVGVPTAVYLKCWNEGMDYEKTGVFTSKTFGDLRRSIKLKFW